LSIHNVRGPPWFLLFWTGCIGQSVLMVVSNNYYGTTIGAVEAVAKTGKKCILDIEMEVPPFPIQPLRCVVN